MSCQFYGYNYARLSRVLVAQGGNQCAVRADGYVPCQMQVDGNDPDWESCPLRKHNPLIDIFAEDLGKLMKVEL